MKFFMVIIKHQSNETIMMDFLLMSAFGRLQHQARLIFNFHDNMNSNMFTTCVAK